MRFYTLHCIADSLSVPAQLNVGSGFIDTGWEFFKEDCVLAKSISAC